MEDLPGGALADRLETALWVFDFRAARIVWANRAALRLWDADSVAALAARDMGAEMSASVRQRLDQHRQDLARDPDRRIRELWTLYPGGRPFRVRAVLTAFALPDGPGMLIEARAEDPSAPETVRSADALLHTRVIVALCDRDGTLLYANPAHRAVFGPGVAAFADPFAARREAKRFLAALAGAPEHRATARMRTVQGVRWLDVHAVRCRDAVTGDGAFLVSATDVTEAREHAQEMKAARDAAETADRAKSVFLATMSHELRTPLNGVLGLASLLSRTDLDASQRGLLRGVASSGERMLELVENMLDMVALDAGEVVVRRAPFDPALILRSAVEAFRGEAEAKGLTLRADAGAVGDGAFVHDAGLLRKVMRQLIGNAVKFTDSGEIVARVRRDGADGLRFEVADTGPGLTEEAKALVFRRFQQGDGSTTRRHGGTGLGLSICAELATLWGGTTGVDSVAGRGATFWFTVPRAAHAVCDRP
jgi:signal transduction histidine kinase